MKPRMEELKSKKAPPDQLGLDLQELPKTKEEIKQGIWEKRKSGKPFTYTQEESNLIDEEAEENRKALRRQYQG